MKSNYKRIGNYIKEVKIRNKDLQVNDLRGINIQKYFMPSVANTIGTDMSKYKIVKQGQFACNRMHVGRDKRLPVALHMEKDNIIVSPAYTVFEVIDENVVFPEYLMMWFSRKEFDREVWFYTDSDVRGGLSLDDFLNINIPIIPIEKQRKIVKEYNTILNRINLNENMIGKLECLGQSIYKEYFEQLDNIKGIKKLLSDVVISITDGKHGDCKDEENSGYYFISVKDIVNGEINYDNARQITRKDFEETNKRTKAGNGDILLTNSGTIGKMAILKDIPETAKTTFQKSVAIIKPNPNIAPTNYLYSILKYRINEIRDLAGGSTQSNLLLGDLRNVEIVCAEKTMINEFESKVKSIFDLKSILGKKQKILLKLKDILLGQISLMEE